MSTRVTKSGRTVAVPDETGLCYGSGMRAYATHRGLCPKCGQKIKTEGQARAEVRYYIRHLRPQDKTDSLDLWTQSLKSPFSPDSLSPPQSSSTSEGTGDDCPF